MGAVVWMTTHIIINFQVADPEQGLDQERWQMDGRGLGHAWALRLSGLDAGAGPVLKCGPLDVHICPYLDNASPRWKSVEGFEVSLYHTCPYITRVLRG